MVEGANQFPQFVPLEKSRGWPHSKAESSYSWAVPLPHRPLIGLHGALNPVLGASESLQAPSKRLRCVTEACHRKRGKVSVGRACGPEVELYRGRTHTADARPVAKQLFQDQILCPLFLPPRAQAS